MKSVATVYQKHRAVLRRQLFEVAFDRRAAYIEVEDLMSFIFPVMPGWVDGK